MLFFGMALIIAVLMIIVVVLAVRNNRLVADNKTLFAQVAYHQRTSGRRSARSNVLQGRLDSALADVARYKRAKEQAVVDLLNLSCWVDDNCVARCPTDGRFSRLDASITSPPEVTFTRTGHTIEL